MSLQDTSLPGMSRQLGGLHKQACDLLFAGFLGIGLAGMATPAAAQSVTLAGSTKLDSMRVGDVDVYNVDAVVTAGSMPFVLLGNSF